MPENTIRKTGSEPIARPFAELHSEELHEIIRRPPTWPLRWGITLFFVLLLVLVAGSWFIRYPDTVSATATITVAPPATDRVRAIIKVSPSSLGKLSVGQKVLIKMEAFPYREFGVLTGILSHISLSPGPDNLYWGYVHLPQQLKTTQARTLPRHIGMRGQAEILTKEKRLAERIFFKIKEE